MDINIARCIKRQPGKDAAGLLAGIHSYTSKSIKFEFTRRFDSLTSNNTLEPKRKHCNPQADPLRYSPLLTGLEPESNQLFCIHSSNLPRKR